MYRQAELELYLRDAAARQSAPGGGSVSALTGALAAAMSEMAGRFSLAEDGPPSAEGPLQEMLRALEGHHEALLDLVDRDVKAYRAYEGARGLPRLTPRQKAERRDALTRALRDALAPVVEIVRHAAQVGAIAVRLAEVGNPRLLSDVGVSAVLAEAACAGARYSVEANLRALKDADLRREIGEEMERLCQSARRCREIVHEKVTDYLAA